MEPKVVAYISANTDAGIVTDGTENNKQAEN
jgi:hypothetical protein